MASKNQIPKNIIDKCRQKLLKTKSDLLNQIQMAKNHIVFAENRKGDEADQTVHLMEEKAFLSRNERIHSQLTQVETALARIEQGCYGLCEETGEPIETNRLMALPWTSLSIEGAEMRESIQKKYAR